jgi:hypothetical protein
LPKKNLPWTWRTDGILLVTNTVSATIGYNEQNCIFVYVCLLGTVSYFAKVVAGILFLAVIFPSVSLFRENHELSSWALSSPRHCRTQFRRCRASHLRDWQLQIVSPNSFMWLIGRLRKRKFREMLF